MGQTTRDSEAEESAGEAVPGIVLVYHGEQPICRAVRIPEGGLVIGRDLVGRSADDDRLSREHTRVKVVGDHFTVADLMSRNGTYLEGALLERETQVATGAVVRSGRTVGVLLADIRRFEGNGETLETKPAARPLSDAELRSLHVEQHPLRQRPDRIAALVYATVKRVAPRLAAHASLVEMCLRKPWLHDLARLSDEVHRLAAVAVATGQSDVREQKEGWQQRATEQLRTRPPKAFSDPPSVPPAPEDKYVRVMPRVRQPQSISTTLDNQGNSLLLQIAAALRDHQGDVDRAARALGLTEARLRGYLARFPELQGEPGGEGN